MFFYNYNKHSTQIIIGVTTWSNLLSGKSYVNYLFNKESMCL